MPNHIPDSRTESFKTEPRPTRNSGVKTLSYEASPIASSRQVNSTLANHGVNPIFSEDPKIYSPTFREIQENKYKQNFMGSKFTSRDSDDGVEFVHYEDGSILITNESRGEYHFFTAAGQKHKAHLLRVTSRLFDDADLLKEKPKLGQGKFSQVHKIELQHKKALLQ